MVAYMCDRCKKFYSLASNKRYTISLNDSSVALDICPYCYKELYKWIYNGKVFAEE